MASVVSPVAKRQDSGIDMRLPIPSLDDLHHLDPDRFVAKYTDIAAVNLACARGLPDTEESEFPEYLMLLDTIATAVQQETERMLRLFKLKPAQFHHSEAVFRLYTMEHVFRRRFNIRYDSLVEESVKNRRRWNTSDSSEIFIHGILSDKRTGTCSSLPTFAIAVGRRLGYPLKLVLVPNHTLYRWDDGDEVFNLQHTEAGGEIRSDESFHEWPVEWTPEDFAMNKRTKVWLHSMTPRQVVSKFLCNRAILLTTLGRCDEALPAIDAARRFNPDNPACPSIREEIQFRKHNPRGLASFPWETLSQLPLSTPATALLEKLTPFARAASPFTQPPAPFPTGPQPFGTHVPHPGPVDPRLLIELHNQLQKQAVPHAQSQTVVQTQSLPLTTNLQTVVGTVGVNIEPSQPQ